MFYLLMYSLLTFGSFTILYTAPILIKDILVLALTTLIFFLMFIKHISDLGGKSAAKGYYKRLININDSNQITEKMEAENILNPQIPYEQARAQLVNILENKSVAKLIPNDGSDVVINDDRFKVGKTRWSFLLLVFLFAGFFTPYLSNWAFYIFSLMNFIMIFVAMAPFIMESYHGYKKSGIKKTLKWVSLGILAIFILNIINGFVFDIVGFKPESKNQEIIEIMLNADFFRVAFEVTLTAAIFEELVFRGLFFRNLYTKNKFLAYLVTFLTFGLPHLFVGFIGGAGLSEFMYLPIYGGMGVIFAYIYQKTNSVFTAMGAHFFNNLISVISILFI